MSFLRRDDKFCCDTYRNRTRCFFAKFIFFKHKLQNAYILSCQNFRFINNIKCIKKILVYNKIFILHYILFTPLVCFVFIVKSFFAYYFNKAPTIFLRLANAPSRGNELKFNTKKTQVLIKRKSSLCYFAVSIKLEGGVC